MVKLIPQPKRIEENEGSIKNIHIKLQSVLSDDRLKNAIEKLPLSECGVELNVVIEDKGTEGYSLNINTDRIEVKAESMQGAFYAIQTLRQLCENEEVPCCYIEDEPDFKHRGFYHDVTRGKVPTVETLKKLIDYMAYYKLNSLQLYVEHTFEFEEYKDSIERTGYLTKEEIICLDRYCKDNFIEFIPSLSCFGHLYELLQKDRYIHLREAENYNAEHMMWRERLLHHTIDPLNDESFELIKSLIDQYEPLFTSNKFNICCDETFDLQNGRHKDMDTGELYIGFVKKIIEYLHKKGKKVMMWGDILLLHPELIDEIPKNVTMLNWYYEKDRDVAKQKIKEFKNADRIQYVCPAVWGWNHFCEKLSWSLSNISIMAEEGFKHGAEGVLNTNWGDYGNSCSLDLEMCSMAFGAEKSWNVKTTEEEFLKKTDFLLYKHTGATEYLRRISDVQKYISYQLFAKYYSNITSESQLELDEPYYEVVMPSMDTAERMQRICIEIIEQLKKEQWEKDEYRKEMLIATEGLLVMCEILAKIQGFDIERYTDTENWLDKYRKAWLEKNKESELFEIEKMFLTMEGAITLKFK